MKQQLRTITGYSAAMKAVNDEQRSLVPSHFYPSHPMKLSSVDSPHFNTSNDAHSTSFMSTGAPHSVLLSSGFQQPHSQARKYQGKSTNSSENTPSMQSSTKVQADRQNPHNISLFQHQRPSLTMQRLTTLLEGQLSTQSGYTKQNQNSSITRNQKDLKTSVTSISSSSNARKHSKKTHTDESLLIISSNAIHTDVSPSRKITIPSEISSLKTEGCILTSKGHHRSKRERNLDIHLSFEDSTPSIMTTTAQRTRMVIPPTMKAFASRQYKQTTSNRSKERPVSSQNNSSALQGSFAAENVRPPSSVGKPNQYSSGIPITMTSSQRTHASSKMHTSIGFYNNTATANSTLNTQNSKTSNYHPLNSLIGNSSTTSSNSSGTNNPMGNNNVQGFFQQVKDRIYQHRKKSRQEFNTSVQIQSQYIPTTSFSSSYSHAVNSNPPFEFQPNNSQGHVKNSHSFNSNSVKASNNTNTTNNNNSSSPCHNTSVSPHHSTNLVDYSFLNQNMKILANTQSQSPPHSGTNQRQKKQQQKTKKQHKQDMSLNLSTGVTASSPSSQQQQLRSSQGPPLSNSRREQETQKSVNSNGARYANKSGGNMINQLTGSDDLLAQLAKELASTASKSSPKTSMTLTSKGLGIATSSSTMNSVEDALDLFLSSGPASETPIEYFNRFIKTLNSISKKSPGTLLSCSRDLPSPTYQPHVLSMLSSSQPYVKTSAFAPRAGLADTLKLILERPLNRLIELNEREKRVFEAQRKQHQNSQAKNKTDIIALQTQVQLLEKIIEEQQGPLCSDPKSLKAKQSSESEVTNMENIIKQQSVELKKAKDRENQLMDILRTHSIVVPDISKSNNVFIPPVKIPKADYPFDDSVGVMTNNLMPNYEPWQDDNNNNHSSNSDESFDPMSKNKNSQSRKRTENNSCSLPYFVSSQHSSSQESWREQDEAAFYKHALEGESSQQQQKTKAKETKQSNFQNEHLRKLEAEDQDQFRQGGDTSDYQNQKYLPLSHSNRYINNNKEWEDAFKRSAARNTSTFVSEHNQFNSVNQSDQQPFDVYGSADKSLVSDSESDAISIGVNDFLASKTQIDTTLRDKLKINLGGLQLNLANGGGKGGLQIPKNEAEQGKDLQSTVEIIGYHDEFMNQFEDFSQSWRDAINAERRYDTETQPISLIYRSEAIQ